MHKCKQCNATYDQDADGKGYISWCSHKCYQAYKLAVSPDIVHRWHEKIWRRQKYPCCICGFVRAVDKCHIKWRKDGGKVNKGNIAYLCPNHHRLFDRNLLTASELNKIKPIGEYMKTTKQC